MDSMCMTPALDTSQIVEAFQSFNQFGPRVDESSLAFIRDAVASSMNALRRLGKGHLSRFLTAHHKSVRTVVLVKDPLFYARLIDLQPAQPKWGEEAMLLDLTGPATRLNYLQAVANFGGEVHLVGIELSKDEAPLFLQELCSSPTPPHSLHVYGSFYSKLEAVEVNRPLELLETISKNGKIKALTVAYAYDLDFLNIRDPIPSLQALTLIGVQVGDEVLEQISARLDKWVSLMSLTFSHVQSATKHLDFHGVAVAAPSARSWQKSFSNFVRKDCHHLKHLALEGFFLNEHFLDFIKLLLTNSSLQSLSLARCSHFSSLDKASVTASIVDAIHKSEFHINLEGTFMADDPAIKAQLGKKKAKHHQVLKSYEKVPATAVRLFICGDSYAGKTTLLSTLSKNRNLGSHLRWIGGASRGKNKRTRGIEVRKLFRDGIRVSAWDMAGQEEFHAFHDHIFPDMSAHGAPALFLFVWSPIDSKDDGKGELKSADTFEASFRYWLKFIASNTRPSNVARKVIVVLTRKDQMDLVRDSISTHLSILQDTFQMVIEIASVWEVDARNHSSVGVVASAIFECAKSVLKDVMVYKVCDELSTHLTTMGLSILAWEDFQKLCSEKFEIFETKQQTAIALSLHESGHLIYVRNMPFLILDTNWFCCKVMGELIHFSGPSARAFPFRGFVPQHYLEKLLEQGALSGAKMSAGHLVDLMEAMHLCCRVPGDAHSNVFIPSTLPSHRIGSRTLCWRTSERAADFFHAGRRLQCQDKVVTFLTPGIFHVIQVTFEKAFAKLGADIELHRYLISIYYQYMEIIVEFCKANGENVMDILVRSSDEVDPSLTLKVMEEKVVRAMVRMCAEPIGNQGVKLVQGVIRPKCLVSPALSHEREDQCVLAQQLKEDLKLQLQERPQRATFFHTWKHNQYFEAGADSIMDLLGLEEYLDVVKSYKSTLEEVAKEMDAAYGHEQILLLEKQDASNLAVQEMASVSIADGKRQVEMIREGLEEGEDVDTICQGMATSILREIHAVKSKVDIIDTKLDGVGTNLAAMHGELQNLAILQGRVLQQIQ